MNWLFSQKLTMLDRKHWNRDKINREVAIGVNYEKKEFLVLKKLFKNDAEVRVVAHANNSDRFDVGIECLKNGAWIETIKIELETGYTQWKWLDKLPGEKSWPMGCNVLARKISEGKHYDVFLKFSRNLTSFFCCTYEYAAKYGKKNILKNHSLKYDTCDEVYSISWNRVVNCDGFCFDDFEKLREMLLKICAKKLKF